MWTSDETVHLLDYWSYALLSPTLPYDINTDATRISYGSRASSGPVCVRALRCLQLQLHITKKENSEMCVQFTSTHT